MTRIEWSDQLLHDNERTRVFRALSEDANRHLICKLPRGPRASERLRHERRILERLVGVSGVPQPLPGGASDRLLFEDIGAVTLADFLSGQRMELPAQIAFMLELSTILGAVHRAGVVHKDISPANILLGTGLKPLLIDFDLATTVAEERPGFIQPEEIAGTLTYIAPEQTGRTSRAVNLRADLYALGAVCYELIVGQPPLNHANGDPLQLIHDLLVRVPPAPADLDLRVPRALSDIIMRLLEKEPDRRYQSAEGLQADLLRLRDMLVRGEFATFSLGERDYPQRLLPPSQLVGRDEDIGWLRLAFDNALHGRGACALVSGAPGTGKSTLINELRFMVTPHRGYFVVSKFDQFRQDSAIDVVLQTLRTLFRLMLAQPEAELAATRDSLQRELGGNMALMAGLMPELAAAFAVEPETPAGDPTHVAVRLLQGALGFVRACASPQRPLVMVMDDLQWAGTSVLDFIDTLLTVGPQQGFLLVGAYRDTEIDSAHPLAALFGRWRRLRLVPPHLHLKNLPPAELAALLAAMLHISEWRAAELAKLIGDHTRGNPFDSVELVNALRHDQLLSLGTHGWEWDTDAIRRFVGKGSVIELLGQRIARLPKATGALLEKMACLGNEVAVALLAAAADLSPQTLAECVAPALEDGLLLAEGDRLMFRHDRVQQAAYGGIADERRVALHLQLGARLGANATLAAEQYLAVVEVLPTVPERDRIVDVLSVAAKHARNTSNFGTAENLLRTALSLLATLRADDPRQRELLLARHQVLYSLGRFDEVDALYAEIVAHPLDLLALVQAASIQVCSLSNRARYAEAVAVGYSLLRRFEVIYPEGERAAVQADIAKRMQQLSAWVAADGAIASADRRELDDPLAVAAAQLMNRVSAASFFVGPERMAWLLLETQRLWRDHGCCPAMMTPISTAGFIAIGMLQDYRLGYSVVKHALKVSEELGYTAEAAEAAYLFAAGSKHWFEPLELSIDLTQQAREVLLKAGDLHSAALATYPLLWALFETAPALDHAGAEVTSAMTFAERTGNDHALGTFLVYRQLLRALRGDTLSPGVLDDAEFSEAAYVAEFSPNHMAMAHFHVYRALTALIFDNAEALQHHIDAAQPMLRYVCGFYLTATAQLLRAVSLADRIRRSDPEQHPAHLAALGECRDWMAARAADAPMNFRHLLLWIEAESVWSKGSAWEAVAAFDAALGVATAQQRPWHKAVVCERAGKCHAALGLHQSARGLLAEARRLYSEWGASAKVDGMAQRFGFLRAGTVSRGGGSHSSASISSDQIDLVGILRASQALSSETNLAALRTRVITLLSEMTGATDMVGALWYDDLQSWCVLPREEEGGDGLPIPVEESARRGLLPLSAFNYVLRTREALLVDDALSDDRFAGDPYFEGMTACSLLGLPVQHQGVLRLVLLLQNRLSHGAFSPRRLQAVQMIAGQLVISIANVQLYASLERKVAERTAALESANRQLAELSITDALTGLSNRRRFDSVLETEWLRAIRPGQCLGLVLVDIDEFKRYNDHYGHQDGDQCLRQVAAVLASRVRGETDLVARYGGEEFVMVLPGADPQAAFVVAERARRAVEQLRIPHEKAQHGIVTLSAGIASVVPSAGIDRQALIEAADEKLYLAKHNGRNRVER